MALLYSNENFPLPVVVELRHLGHDVLTVQETGKADRSTSDEDVLAFAASQERAVLTLNRKHFFRLHKETVQHAGIIACTFDPDFAGQAQRIHEGIAGAGELSGKLLRVNRPQK